MYQDRLCQQTFSAFPVKWKNVFVIDIKSETTAVDSAHSQDETGLEVHLTRSLHEKLKYCVL